MSDVILVVLTRPEGVAAQLRASQHLATLIGCRRINVLAIDPDPAAPVAAADGLDAGAAEIFAEVRRTDITALSDAFDAWRDDVQDAGIVTSWFVGKQAPDAVVQERGRRADVLVVARPGPGDDRATRQAFRAALFHTERPVLMVPAKPAETLGRHVAIAWRDDARAVKAVIPCLRFLAHAERVDVLAGVRAGAAAPAAPAVLVEHGIPAALHVLPIEPRPFGRRLLARAAELGADLLVMGAYAHSPLRELILGGVTRYVLAHAEVPVFMRH